jgi:class 3 adenylate cyclase
MSEIRFATSADGTRIAYTTFGSGPPLVEVPRWAQTIEWNSRDDEFAKFYEKLGEFREVTMVERRGTGSSQRKVMDFSMEAHLADVHAVADVVGLQDFDLLGSGDAAAVCVRFAAESPERIRRLVLWGAYRRFEEQARRRATSFAVQQEPDSLQNWQEMFRSNFAMAARIISDDFFPNQPASVARHIAGLWVEFVPSEVAYKYYNFGRSIDVTDWLPKVSAPMLVMHRRNDHTGHLLEYGRDVAASIPNARFVLLDGDVGVHQYQHDEVVAEMRKFLMDPGERPSAPASAIPFRTVLFTDLVGHTEMMSRLGDERGRAVLREHERITREVLKAHGGTEVKTMGDGFMASFGSVTKAVECAIALQRAFAEREGEPLSVRVGLNAGEPIEEDGDLFGATVILASRIAAKAEGGEILVADTVRGLCSGKGFLFSDRGEFVAKGFEEPVRVYEVRWRE